LYRDTLVQEMLDYLNNLTETKRSAVLSELLGDLDLRNRDIPAAITAYQQALKNNPTPQQKVRLVLTLTDKLQTSGRQVEAFDILDHFYKETPDYPDQLSLCEKLEPLASKIKKSDDAKNYRAEIKRLEKLAREKTKK
jgi:predicted Zn-dependent protease